MSNNAGFTDVTLETPYGVAGFWVIDSVYYLLNVSSGDISFTIGLAGYISKVEADAGAAPLEHVGVTVMTEDALAMYGLILTDLQTAIVASAAAWTGATYVPAT